VDAIAEKLDTKLGTWKPEISQEVRALVSQVIDAADNDTLDVTRSRAVEQEVLDQVPPAGTSPALPKTVSLETNAWTLMLSELAGLGPSRLAGPVPTFVIVHEY
jgi:hypothetical protein